jgi:hypothetical protein
MPTGDQGTPYTRGRGAILVNTACEQVRAMCIVAHGASAVGGAQADVGGRRELWGDSLMEVMPDGAKMQIKTGWCAPPVSCAHTQT